MVFFFLSVRFGNRLLLSFVHEWLTAEVGFFVVLHDVDVDKRRSVCLRCC